MGIPNVSKRRYIRWVPEDPSEPTSTLVLTSEQSRFVDIRVLKDTLHELDWAFVGTSESRPAHEEDGRTVPAHSVWTHWVDSRVPYGADPLRDEGDMWPQPDGDMLEKGSMAHPETGHTTAYEELWVDVEVCRTGADERKVCVVLTVDEPERSARGMVIRIGQWCQGIVRVGDDLGVERWRYGTGEDGLPEDSSKWERLVKIGKVHSHLPCASTFSPAIIKVGDVVMLADLRWKVVEKHEW